LSEPSIAQLYVVAEEGSEWQGAFLLTSTPMGKNWVWLARELFESSEDLVEHAEDLIAHMDVELEIFLCSVLGRVPMGGEEEEEMV
jgi:hypothetical protein